MTRNVGARPADAGGPRGTERLFPVQQRALDDLLQGLRVERIATLVARGGMGRTTVLRAAHAALGGAFLTARDFLDAMAGQHPLAMEETFFRVLRDAMQAHDVVITDDAHLVTAAMCCGHAYPRLGYLAAPMAALAAAAADGGAALVFAADPHHPPLPVAGHRSVMAELGVEDYALVCRAHLGAERAAALDVAKIHRFAPKLSARQLRSACEWLRDVDEMDAERFIAFLRARHMVSNVDLGEVQAVELGTLKGVDDVIRTLEANVILPLEHADLAAEMSLRPKRGVLLAGPPGTGKTTIGRALAHRLKGKFFLIDGTFISGTASFYGRVMQVFDAAKQNAPSVIFIDDSDVIFESGAEMGLYRYLLTMLDGLESESAARVCVMMTAMDVGNLPPALVRSGRIELWLDMRLPDEAARAAILADHLAGLPAAIGPVDVTHLAGATEGLAGADLKRLVEDGKLLFAYDTARRQRLRPAVEYFLEAAETVRANRERYAEAEARARQQRPARPPWFDTFPGVSVVGGHVVAFEDDIT